MVDFITNDVSLNEPIDSAITPLTVPSTTMQTNNGYDCESIGGKVILSYNNNENCSFFFDFLLTILKKLKCLKRQEKIIGYVFGWAFVIDFELRELI